MGIRPLDSVVVLDLSQAYFGPYCTLMLSYLGADVIKVERPGGEHTRRRAADMESAHELSLLSSNKRDIVIDLKSEVGRDLFLRMVAKSHVVVENFAPGVMESLRLSMDYLEQANPKIVLASGKGFRNDSPFKHLPALDNIIQAMDGIVATTGAPDGPPMKAGVAIVDFISGTALTAAVLAALLAVERTGEGQQVEVAMEDAVIPTLCSNISGYLSTNGTVSERVGNRHAGLALAPYNIYPTNDGWVAITCSSDDQWRRLTELMGMPNLAEDGRFKRMPDRACNTTSLDEIVSAWTSARPVAEIVAGLSRARVPGGPVRSIRELMEDPYLSKTMLPIVEHPVLGRTRAFGNAIRFQGCEDEPLRPSPTLGQHTDEVLKELLRLTPEQITELRDQGHVA